uniref:Uncharacterized protein n=1 Tax=Klebsiella phage FKP3 TaxID=3231233 RepID=A0AAU8HZ36_9CAUD
MLARIILILILISAQHPTPQRGIFPPTIVILFII